MLTFFTQLFFQKHLHRFLLIYIVVWNAFTQFNIYSCMSKIRHLQFVTMLMTSFHLHKGYMFKMIYMPNIGSNKCYAKGLKDEELYTEI